MADPRVVWVPFTKDAGVASVRLRSLRPVAYLRRRGWDVCIDLAASTGDVVVFQKAYEAKHLEMARAVRRRGGKVILDLCDNHLYNPHGRPELADRAERLREMIALAHTVTVSTQVLRDQIAPTASIVDDAVELPGTVLRRVLELSHRVPHPRLRLLWFGNAGAAGLSFGMSDLAERLPVLEELARGAPLELLVCSNDRDMYRRMIEPAQLRTRYLPWSRQRFVSVAALSDVAVVPVNVNPYTLPKTANRLATALLHDLPSVSDPHPSHLPFERVVPLQDWPAALDRYRSSAQARRADAATGARLARSLYAPARIAQQWEAVLRVLAAR